MIVNPDKPARNILSGGKIRRTEPPKIFTEKLCAATKADMPGLYAEEGIWYDALFVISQLIEANPANKTFRDQRADLLEQVGLHKVAVSEKSEK
ncbi:DUF928 [Desulfonema magnum]|uniref:DUF928 n=2 Tax=Desulfonema magnum TaxID=45655 RepID=A0A975GRL9_9BACT|nr:DUF928 [Desulfonema magnum]